jgi:plasmid maintenance system antidote protein VapI
MDDLISRLELLMDHYELSASAFSDAIGVQRSSISHLISGRNKPSLDFILKVNTRFPEVDLYWLLLGEGDLIKKSKGPDLFTKHPEESKPDKTETVETEPSKTSPTDTSKSDFESDVDKIVFFHKNGRFKIYTP